MRQSCWHMRERQTDKQIDLGRLQSPLFWTGEKKNQESKGT